MDIVHRCHFHGCTTPTPRKWLYETIHSALFMDLRDELKPLNKNLIPAARVASKHSAQHGLVTEKTGAGVNDYYLSVFSTVVLSPSSVITASGLTLAAMLRSLKAWSFSQRI